MADVFGRQELTYGGSFAADSATVTFSTGLCDAAGVGAAANPLAAGVGMLAQQVQFQYTQPIQRFFELGSQQVYYFAGRPTGMGTIARLVGPRAINASFYQRLGNVCCAGSNNLTFSVATGCSTVAGAPVDPARGRVNYNLRGVIANSIGGTVASEDMIFREAISFVFFAMSIEGGAANPAANGGNPGGGGGGGNANGGANGGAGGGANGGGNNAPASGNSPPAGGNNASSNYNAVAVYNNQVTSHTRAMAAGIALSGAIADAALQPGATKASVQAAALVAYNALVVFDEAGAGVKDALDFIWDAMISANSVAAAVTAVAAAAANITD